MPDVINDMGVLKRYGALALNGYVVPACGCVLGGVFWIFKGLWYGFEEFRDRTWQSARLDHAAAHDAFAKAATK